MLTLLRECSVLRVLINPACLLQLLVTWRRRQRIVRIRHGRKHDAEAEARNHREAPAGPDQHQSAGITPARPVRLRETRIGQTGEGGNPPAHRRPPENDPLQR